MAEELLPEAIAGDATHESALWAAALRAQPDWEPVFSPLAPDRFALGLETIYEAYLVHYGEPRLFAPGEESERVLLGDYLYAHGLVRVAKAGGVDAVAAMAELISRCASLRAAGEDGDGEAWVAAARSLGGDPSGDEIAVGAASALGAVPRRGCRYDPAVIYDAASDGSHVIIGMLIVGLIFLGVIGVGELVRSATHRRKARRPRTY